MSETSHRTLDQSQIPPYAPEGSYGSWQPELPFPDPDVASNQYDLPYAMGTFPDDPQPINELIFPVMDVLDSRSAQAELDDARTAHRALTLAGLSGKDVTQQELDAASERLSNAQQWFSKSHPPNQ